MISNLAVVHPNSKIGKNVTIEAFTTIQSDVEIGDDCWIGSNVSIMDGARIGKNVKVFPGAVISAVPQDLKYRGEPTLAVIGNNTVIREYVTVNKGTTANLETVVGENCLLMAAAHIAHDCIIGDNCILANCALLAGHIIIEDYAIIGGLTAIHQFVKIGKHTMISGGSLVRKDVPPFVKAAREPLSYAGVNSIGLRRRGYSNEQIVEIQNVYRHIFLSKLNVTKAVAQVEALMLPTPERDEILSFINTSTRGIMKGYNGRSSE